MPGMNTGLNVSDPTVVAAFKTALLHQGLIALLIFFVVGIIWLSLRAWLPAAAKTTGSAVPEPAWRQLLRYGFGIIWLLDGILQAQPKMAVGLPSQVIEPTAASSPHWVQVVVNWAGTAWSYHPLQAGASAVWIQVGIGVWLLTAPRGPLSRLAGLVSVAWGLVVWAFGESFGGIFAPGLTWLFGAPGAVLVYCVAGALIALPDRAWSSRLPGRLMMAGLGTFLIGMAVLQAWPGRGFWQGTAQGQPGTLASMTAAMAPTPQPHLLSSWITAFTGFDENWLGSNVKMYWSHADADTYADWLDRAGFTVLRRTLIPERESGHALFLARKRPGSSGPHAALADLPETTHAGRERPVGSRRTSG